MKAFDLEVKRIGGALKVAVAKKIHLKRDIKRVNDNLRYIEGKHYEEQETEDIKDTKDVLNREKNKLNDELKARNEEIAILKGEISKQITQIKESISKFLDGDTALGERIKTLFKEQGITIASILTALGFIISTIVEAVIPGSSGAINSNNNPNNPDKKSNWVKDKLKVLAGLLGKLGEKFAEALPCNNWFYCCLVI